MREAGVLRYSASSTERRWLSRRPMAAFEMATRGVVFPKGWAWLVFMAAVVTASLVSPVGAAPQEDPRAAREAARARRTQLARELDTARASESQLADAAEALKESVRSQAAAVEAARQAVSAASAELAQATTDLERTRAAIRQLRSVVVDRAVSAYMSPGSIEAMGFDDTTDLAATTRREVLLSSVAANDENVVDLLNAAEEDHDLARAAADDARRRAAARRAETERRLAQLEKDRADADRLVDAVSARTQELLAEIDAQARSEAELTRVINERAAQQEQARLRAQRDERDRQQREQRERRPPQAPPTTTRPGPSRDEGDASKSSSDRCIWPTKGRVTSEFGTRSGRLHAGIDIGAPTGTPIWAAKEGTVIFAGQQSGYGNVVVIDHGGGMTTLYAHQSRLATTRGAAVGQGSTIGYVGNTGRSTGPHLHFETRYEGSPRNPRNCLS